MAKIEHKHQSERSRLPTTRANPDRLPCIAIIFLLAIAVIFGGGGVRYGLANLVVQLSALAILAIFPQRFLGFWKGAPIALRALVACSLLLPLLHLVPVPETVWSGLPGRDLVVQSYELIGISGWSAISVAPSRTLVALTGLIAPLTVLTIGWTLDKEDLIWAGWALVLLGLASFLLGVIQVTSYGTEGVPYPEKEPSAVLFGSFANRNSMGLFLVGSLALAALLQSPLKHPAVLPVRLGICLFLIVGVILTRSRTALVLMAIPLSIAAIFALVWLRERNGLGAKGLLSGRLTLVILGAIGVSLAATTLVVASAPGRIGETISRFDSDGDPRAYIWEDSMYAASRYWPIGAGMGTYDEVFQTDESLENMTKRRAGRAHNDYIEIAIEAGLPAITLASLWLFFIGYCAWAARRSSLRWAAWGCAGFLLTIALQSITDYPLRNQTMLVCAAFALLFLARSTQTRSCDNA